MDNLKFMKKGKKFWLSLAIESIRQGTTFKGEQISYTEFKKFETKLNQWKSTAGNRDTRKNEVDSRNR